MTFKLNKKSNKYDCLVRHLTKALNSNFETPLRTVNTIANCEVTREVGTEDEKQTVSWLGNINKQSQRIPMIDFDQQQCADYFKSTNFKNIKHAQPEDRVTLNCAVSEMCVDLLNK